MTHARNLATRRARRANATLIAGATLASVGIATAVGVVHQSATDASSSTTTQDQSSTKTYQGRVSNNGGSDQSTRQGNNQNQQQVQPTQPAPQAQSNGS